MVAILQISFRLAERVSWYCREKKLWVNEGNEKVYLFVLSLLN